MTTTVESQWRRNRAQIARLQRQAGPGAGVRAVALDRRVRADRNLTMALTLQGAR